MNYKTYLGAQRTLVDDPKGWDTLMTVLERDRVLKGLLKKQDGTFEFGGTGFDYLFTAYKNNSWNYVVPVYIECSLDGMTYFELLQGNIILSDVEFDLKLKYAKAKIYDDSYQAKISGNKNVGAFLYASRSKLNKTITAITPVPLKFFKPSDGSYYSITSTGGYENNTIRVYDALRFLVAFMTEDSVDFISDDFGPNGPYYNYFITTGRILQLVDSSQADWPSVTQSEWETYWEKVSYATLFSEIDKRFNLGFQIEPTGSPTLRIESNRYFSTNDVVYSNTEVDELKLSTLTQYLYSRIIFGQGETDDSASLSFPEQITFVGFKSEEFQTVLEAPRDVALDLTCKWISSSNVIERLIVDGLLNDRDNDRKIFIIEGELDGSDYRAKQANPFTGTAPYFYNQSLTNNKIAERYYDGIPSSIATFVNSLDYSFKAVTTGNGEPVSGYFPPYTSSAEAVLTYNPLRYDDDYVGGYDSTNSYGNGTAQGTPITAADSLYTAQTGGLFTFSTYNNIHVTQLTQTWLSTNPTYVTQDAIYIRTSIRQYDSSNTFITQSFGPPIRLNSNSTIFGTVNTPGIYASIASGTFNVNVGDYFLVGLEVKVVYNQTAHWATNFTINLWNGGSLFASTQTATGGGIYQESDVKNSSVLLIESKVPMKISEFDGILANTKGSLNIGRYLENSYIGNIENIKFPHEKGEANILLNSSVNINF